ncbi:similar to Saccharomyces cerevisiae YAL019W FUN30 Conserved member of the Snf2p family with ATP-dependent chromatin remodelin activity [Maudiozyma barnettii]|uniref:DNA helicase n=1 Tax=Maudiozyma barnettii TaxID=61262 RepID=A0A8H2ZKL7_9SACH|nr:DNA-dependent ATPase FUN30 [Kazachstania barnettii]CAB4255307.1 similar to Saccharomyces cerevisiae YAL019W FUN30 Conserved member of the Snf2p family with ATP-dependent chromatin remodelin activity [Kazachstania barnettii]CAD1783714.1 similar to Saccharomyces cerevisiae YAL019W FUN30 Conserved member of the Snf2p family with ATP-dependent chromatin remodelin activity [Kazachstania barnettii]
MTDSFAGDDEVQVPETSSPTSRILSSSPLKSSGQETAKDQTASLRDKFMYKPNLQMSNDTAKSTVSPVEHLATLQKEFPDFSSTLIQAVFKSNASDIGNARARLNRIQEQRSSWAKSPSTTVKAKASSTARLNSISSSKSKQSVSTKINVNKPKSSIFDRYSTSMKRAYKKREEEDGDYEDYDEDDDIAGVHRGKNGMLYDPSLLSKIKNSKSLKMVSSSERHNKQADGKKKRKLVRGSELDNARSKMLDNKVKKLMKDDSEGDDLDDLGSDVDEDQSGSDVEYEDKSSTAIDIDDQTLEFLNTSDPSDLADLADTTFEKAKVIVSKRPFSNLDHFVLQEFLTEEEIAKTKDSKEKTKGKRGYRGNQKKETERFLDKIKQSIRGYNAIDSLLKTCASYGTSIEKQMKTWGVDLNSNGESNSTNPNDNAGIPVISIDDKDDDDEEEEDDDDDEVKIKHPKNEAIVEEFDETEASVTPTPTPSSLALDVKPKSSATDGDSDFELEEEEEEDIEDEDEDYEEIAYSKRPTMSSRAHRRNMKLAVQRKGPVKYFKGKPRLLSSDIQLKDYQQMGINWLNLLYHNGMSCILADDMGLGKTCQVIAFLAYLKQINEPGPNLIVVPSSTLENWLREFKKFCPSMKVEPYYGSQQERAELRDYLERTAGQYDVVVTTYNLAAGNKYDVAFLKSSGFNVVVYDEGHMLKNSMSERFNKLMKIKAKFRLLLTGTPLQNNLRELMSLLEFIMPSLFISKKDSLTAIFKQRAKTTDGSDDHNPLLVQEAIERAKTMMKPFILRRHKDQVLRHLPKKHNKIVMCELNDVQRKIYDRAITNAKQYREKVANGTVTSDDKANMDSKNLIMTLRKASIHPLLFREIYDNKTIDAMSTAILSEPAYSMDGNKQYIQEDMSYMTDFELHKLCGNFPRTLGKYALKNNEWMQSGKVDKLEQILKDVIDNKKEKILIFSLFTQVLDILEPVLSTMGYKFLRLDGSTQVNERQSLIDTFYEDNSIPVFLLSTKAGGFGINLVCANHVVIFDQSFNPHDDRQAADRSHRVGQTKEVYVSTLISQDSIEEQIHQLAKNKLALDMHVSEDNGESKQQEAAAESKINGILEDIIYKT